MNRGGILAVIRRPWSKPTLVLVTALIAGLGGYAVAATRPPEKTPEAVPSMVVESWLSELERDQAVESVGEPAEAALKAVPPGVDVAHKTVVVQNPYAMSGSGLLALPAGKWAVYASCRMGEDGDLPAGFKVGLGIAGGGVERYIELDCPVDGGEALDVLEPDEDTVFTLSLMPDAAEDPESEEFWEASLVAGVFLVAV